MLYRLKIYKSFKGRGSANNQWSNEYGINTNLALDSAEIVALCNQIVAWEKDWHLTAAHFMRMTISTYAKEADRSDPNAFRVVELSGTGLVDVPATTEAEITAITLRVKFGSITGRGGMKYYRGVLTEAMVTAGSDGTPQMVGAIANYDVMAGNLLLNLGEGVMVTPNTKADDGTPTKPVTLIRVAGISLRQTAQKRKKKIPQSESSWLSYLDEALEIAGLAAMFYLTKGRSAAPAATELAASKGSQIVSTLQNIISKGLGQIN